MITSRELLWQIMLGRIEVFTWIAPQTGEALHFNATAMREYAEQSGVGMERIRFQLVAEDIEMVRVHRAVDPLRAALLPIEQLKRPVLGILFPDDSTVTVDGHHRMVRWYELGLKEGMMYRFAWGTWQQFLLQLPPEISQQFRQDVESSTPPGPPPSASEPR